MLILSAHEICYAACRTGRCHHASAQRRETSEALLYIDSREVAEHQRACYLLLCVVVLLSEDHDRQCRRYALVARARVGHYRNHGSCHTCVARAACGREDMREHAVAHYAASERSAECLSQLMSVVPEERFGRCSLVQPPCVVYELYIGERCCRGEVVDCAQA